MNKALADFATRGWVRREGRAVVLLDMDRLERARADRPHRRDVDENGVGDRILPDLVADPVLVRA